MDRLKSPMFSRSKTKTIEQLSSIILYFSTGRIGEIDFDGSSYVSEQ